MAILIVLPAPGEANAEGRELLARASGEPLPMPRPPVFSTVPGNAPPVVPQQRPVPVRALPPDPLPPGANWSSPPQDDARMEAIARSVTVGALEVLAGVRPLQQMSRWLDLDEFERLQMRTNLERGRAAASGARARRNVRILRVRVCPVAEGIYEVAVVAAETSTVRAAALRLELRRGLWKVTALEIG
ncbi:Rv3235 family protein [Arthrobacter sp. zg-Y916]|uniref:Rv3235 family protein n=1 Tax=Arthrobacter caoxuetaonis TaxID=2886935 RepID=A0A9X1MCE7_9MICC|nr:MULTISPECIES: Rv3235 family protein [Arthrobacter]MCC3296765.1 Rv3235 family protein [Arthrobacter caoxuetaonis]MCC9192854.1 Rv3235 family protein [Arthrobacter sp. zg-Y916]USQ56416.1 Rv3235 family protein [Arthrobacter caoxuetaonis]